MGAGAGLELLGGLGAIAATYFSARDKKRAEEDNIRRARELNELNHRLFQQSRGLGGYAFLPLYADAGQEKALFEDAISYYESINAQPPDELISSYQNVLARYQPIMASGRGFLEDVYSGANTGQRLSEAIPAARARMDMANIERQARELEIAKALSEGRGEAQRKGFSGTGEYEKARLLEAGIAGRQSAARLEGLARVQNAEEVQGIYEQGRSEKASMLGQADTLAGSELALREAPFMAAAQRYELGLAPVRNFMMEPTAFQYGSEPARSGISVAGDTIMAGSEFLSSLGGAVGTGGVKGIAGMGVKPTG